MAKERRGASQSLLGLGLMLQNSGPVFNGATAAFLRMVRQPKWRGGGRSIVTPGVEGVEGVEGLWARNLRAV